MRPFDRPHTLAALRSAPGSTPPRQITQEADEGNPNHLHRLAKLKQNVRFLRDVLTLGNVTDLLARALEKLIGEPEYAMTREIQSDLPTLPPWLVHDSYIGVFVRQITPSYRTESTGTYGAWISGGFFSAR